MSQSSPGIGMESPSSRKKLFWTEKRVNSLTAYLYISPFFLLFAVFGIYPIFYTMYLSFFKWDAMGPMKYVGLDNYRFVLEDDTFWVSFKNTLLMGAMGTVPQLLCALLLAVVLNSALTRFKQFWRVLYFLPNITSIVAVTLVFSAFFANDGIANYLVNKLGYEDIVWRTDGWGLKVAISAMVFWRWVGYNMIIYLSGLQSIPYDLYEAAKIDGATKRQQLTYITLPMLRPFLIFTIMMSTIGSLQLFTEPFVFMSQGNGTASVREEGVTMVMYLYAEAFNNHFFGTAAATAVILFVFTILFSAANMWLSSRFGGTESRGGH